MAPRRCPRREDLHGDVRVEEDLAAIADDLATADALDRRREAVLQLGLEREPHDADQRVLSVLEQRALDRGQATPEHAEQEVVALIGLRLGRSLAVVLRLEAHHLAGDGGENLAGKGLRQHEQWQRQGRRRAAW
jgi:hypothetical protein